MSEKTNCQDNCQSNNGRFIYTISETEPTSAVFSLLRTGRYFYKTPRSDEKIKFTETDMLIIIQTILCIHLFQLSTNETIEDIIKSGEVSYKPTTTLTPKVVSITDVRMLLDTVFGEGFSAVTKRVVYKWSHLYHANIKNFPFNQQRVCLPSAHDIIKLNTFMSHTFTRDALSPIEMFLLVGSTRKCVLQGSIKKLT